jgi:hypothetical protein
MLNPESPENFETAIIQTNWDVEMIFPHGIPKYLPGGFIKA